MKSAGKDTDPDEREKKEKKSDVRIKDSLILLEVGEADKWELVADEGFGRRKGLDISFINLDVVKVTGVYVTAQLWHNWGHSWKTEAERKRERERVME